MRVDRCSFILSPPEGEVRVRVLARRTTGMKI
jgi:hypothetical protein